MSWNRLLKIFLLLNFCGLLPSSCCGRGGWVFLFPSPNSQACCTYLPFPACCMHTHYVVKATFWWIVNHSMTVSTISLKISINFQFDDCANACQKEAPHEPITLSDQQSTIGCTKMHKEISTHAILRFTLNMAQGILLQTHHHKITHIIMTRSNNDEEGVRGARWWWDVVGSNHHRAYIHNQMLFHLSPVCTPHTVTQPPTSGESAVTMNCRIFSEIRLQAYPMLMAVSCLSPVRTQMRIPACASCLIASGTPSCNLSSIAVQPSRRRSRSISSATSKTLASRFSRLVVAARNFACQVA